MLCKSYATLYHAQSTPRQGHFINKIIQSIAKLDLRYTKIKLVMYPVLVGSSYMKYGISKFREKTFRSAS